MAKLTQVVNVLSTWGYICVVRIKTRPDFGLKINVKRSADFQKNYDEFNAQLQQRREERDKLKADAKSTNAADSEKKEDEQPVVVAQEEESKEASAEGSPAAAKPATEASQTEMTKA